MKTFIINIEYTSKKYDEQGILTYKTHAESEQDASIKAKKYIENETEKDRAYTYKINLIIDLIMLPEIK